MLHPSRVEHSIREKALIAKMENLLDPINLYNITWRNANLYFL